MRPAGGRIGAVRRTLLITFTIAVFGALVALVIWSRSDSSAAEPADPMAAADEQIGETDERPAATELTRRERPSLTRAATGEEQPGARRTRPRTSARSPVREYVNSKGILVRDFRPGDHPDFEGPDIKAPVKVKLDESVVADVKAAVYESVRECRAQIDPAAFADQPRAQAEILLSIDEGQVTTDKARVTLAGMDEKVGTELASCIQKGAKAMAFAAEGHKNISQHRVTMIFPLR